jgi:pyridoxal phosphate enzyme (YggS family)
VRRHVDLVARQAGRDPSAITLVAVSKTVDVARVRAAYDAGQRDFGENRAQELAAKADALPDDVRWHMIGPVQTNKVRSLARRVAWWHTIDRPALVVELARRGVRTPVLIEVNVGGEPQKAGCRRDDVAGTANEVRAAGLALHGLMCVPPVGDDPRPHFAWLRATARDLGLDVLSMGMTSDFEVAIAEGATMVRIGTAIFGARPGGVAPLD